MCNKSFLTKVIIILPNLVDICVAGQYRSDNGTCLPCPENTYSNVTNAAVCVPCEDELSAPAPTGDIGLSACQGK